MRDAGLMLQEWFKVGESETKSATQREDRNHAVEVRHGIYRDKEGALYEVITVAASAENFEPLVIYRELFGDYQHWVAPPETFSADKDVEMV